MIVIIMIFYFKSQFDQMEVYPMGDGQAGIGKGIVGLMLLGIGLLPLIVTVIYGLLQMGKPIAKSLHGYLNMIASILISLLTYIYLHQ